MVSVADVETSRYMKPPARLPNASDAPLTLIVVPGIEPTIHVLFDEVTSLTIWKSRVGSRPSVNVAPPAAIVHVPARAS